MNAQYDYYCRSRSQCTIVNTPIIVHLIQLNKYNELNEMDNKRCIHKIIILAPYCAAAVGPIRFKEDFNHDIGQVMISATFILTEIVF